MSSRPRQTVIDADVLMNLLATDQLEAILSSTGLEGLVCPRTESKALHLDPRAAGGAREIIELEPLFGLGVLTRCPLSPEEIDTFVRLAARVDDGEAQILAVARHRGIAIATDDRKARRLAAELGITVVGTADLVTVWAAAVTDSRVAASAIRDIEVRASYRPGRLDPRREAWDRFRDGH